MSQWSRLKQWLLDEGAHIHPSLELGFSNHGGSTVRSVSSVEPLPEGAIIMEVPRKLMLDLSKFPDLLQTNLHQYPQCQRLDALQTYALRLAVAIGREVSRNDSFWKPWLDGLPSREDYFTVMPSAASDDIWAEFGSLNPVLTNSVFLWIRRKECFQAWQQEDITLQDEALALDWEKMQHLLFHVFARGFPAHDGQGWWMVPAIDMMNTGTKNYVNLGDVNSKAVCEGAARMGHIPERYCRDYDAEPDAHRVYTLRNIPAGVELVHHYCPTCNNLEFLARYGFYLEDNPNPIPAKEINTYRTGAVPDAFKMIGFQKLDCAALWNVVVPILNTTADATSEASRSGWRAPRCYSMLMPGEVRCTLSRISFELCADVWNAEGKGGRGGLRGPDPRDNQHRQRSVVFEGDIRIGSSSASMWLMCLLGLAVLAAVAGRFLQTLQRKPMSRNEVRQEARKDRKKKAKSS